MDDYLNSDQKAHWIWIQCLFSFITCFWNWIQKFCYGPHYTCAALQLCHVRRYSFDRFATWNIFQSFFVRWLYSIFDLIFFTCRVGRHFNFTDSLITATLTYDILKISWMMMDQFSTWTLFTVYLWYSGTDYDMRSARKVVLHCLFLKYVISERFISLKNPVHRSTLGRDLIDSNFKYCLVW